MPFNYRPVIKAVEYDVPFGRHQEAPYDAHTLETVKQDNPEPLRAILCGGISQNPCFSMGESIARLACRFGSLKILKVLLEAGCDPVATDEYGRTCLHEACQAAEPNWHIVGLLLDSHVGLLFCTDVSRMPALAYVQPSHWDAWIDFLDLKAQVYFPRKSKVSVYPVDTQALGYSEDESHSSEAIGLGDDTSSCESMSNFLFSAYESEMAEIVALMDARIGKK
jgi:Ankyrin repeats (many copies)